MSDRPELVIAIDGPSGAGKSSTARGTACRLGLAFLDTGAMYRAVSWACLEDGVDLGDAGALIDRASTADLQIGLDPRRPVVSLDGHDITREIRTPRIAAHVSTVATIPQIRQLLTEQMRQTIAAARRIVVEGRDITTVVWPQAQVKVLLVADPETRIARREAEVRGQAAHGEVIGSIIDRDRKDATVSQFERPAPGVELIDSTYLDLGQVIDQVIGLVPVALR
ncbi:cytidylate kinase [Propionibacterium cyclohexanicum]|uniref:Cytidylate kinase n=1 Tax=Propionibacterium cyclohexanicum TaxID=64702 RepID=A0A1H9Q0Q8_9ACTN|nr:(d)CMP kinase [Propionibacterium cyclohexanicum]SER53982.1 cytidylate kinase [Propionibacterium cyclohexanicum]